MSQLIEIVFMFYKPRWKYNPQRDNKVFVFDGFPTIQEFKQRVHNTWSYLDGDDAIILSINTISNTSREVHQTQGGAR